MIRKWLPTIGILLLGIIFPAHAYAADCDPFASTYECAADDIVDYCSPVGLGRLLENSIYSYAYCDLAFSTGYPDEVFKTVGAQLGMDADGVRAVIERNTIDLDSVSAATKESFLGDENASTANAKLNFYKVVKEAFDKELLIHQLKGNLGPRLKARDIYSNGSILDSPFDLIVDLNIIEQVLFGSQAIWTTDQDIYAWPDEDSDTDSSRAGSPATDSGTPSSSGTGSTGSTGGFQSQPGGDASVGTTECVPPDHPDAALPEPGETTPSGLGQAELPGDPMCIDPQAITFRQFKPSTTGAAPSTESTESTTNQCPPGTYPTKSSTITATADQLGNLPLVVAQPSNYPGPNIGGVYKAYPPSKKPECPKGSTAFDPSLFNLDIGGNTPECIPSLWANKLCSTQNWPDSTGLNSAFISWCVEVKTANKPESPYTKDENCVDCHVAASVDLLNNILSKGVAPLENTKNAFAISSRWSPNLSFDLVTSVKTRIRALGKIKPKTTDQINRAFKDIKKEQANTADENADPSDTDKQPTIAVTESATTTLERTRQYLEVKRKEYEQALKNYRSSTIEQGADQEFYGRINILLQQMKSSFELIQGEFEKMTEGTLYQKKEACTC